MFQIWPGRAYCEELWNLRRHGFRLLRQSWGIVHVTNSKAVFSLEVETLGITVTISFLRIIDRPVYLMPPFLLIQICQALILLAPFSIS